MSRPGIFRIVRIALAAAFMAFSLAAFRGMAGDGALLMRLQFGPAALLLASAFSLGALATVVALAAVTLLFGRFYCAFFCPFGILQDLVGRLSFRKGVRVPDLPLVRYGICGLAFGMLAGGWALPFLIFDPYSNFGRIVGGNFVAGGIAPLAVIVLLAVWKKRIYCTTLCPVGALLGLIAKRSVFQLRFTDKCVKCGKCARECPTGCLDPRSGTLDNERCVRCMNCVAACRPHGLTFTAARPDAAPTDLKRRALLVNGGVLLAGAAAGAVLARTALAGAFRRGAETLRKHFGILPPGAGNFERFAARCTACQLCAANCPERIIVPAPGGDGPVRLDLGRGACRYDCDACSRLCPTGALLPLGLKRKRRTRIAEASFDPRRCIVFQEGEKCGRCAKACPTGAVTLRRTGAPRLDASKCIGCGACRLVCPAREKAMTVHAVDRQIEIDS